MFKRIFIEEDILTHDRTQFILKKLRFPEYKIIDRYDHIWGKVNKPYLQKRDRLSLFIASKRGKVLKTAPPAYGKKGDPHYYFITAFNCIYECSYCYLQGYFNTPDIVFFVNHEDILKKIEEMIISCNKRGQKPWFHAGEFSDSLSLSHITGELSLYFDLFSRYPDAYLELRTKSANINQILKNPPLTNIIISISLSPDEQIKKYDLKTSPLKRRLTAIKILTDFNFQIGIHFDPIIAHVDVMEMYHLLLQELMRKTNIKSLAYLSLGVVRFTKDVFHRVKKNYPQADFHSQELIRSFDGKIRYLRPLRGKLLRNIKNLAMEEGITEDKIYLCMEDLS